ncbi:MAG: leucine-rich repeat domain-containing protein [Calditrichaeota bacterium]|nr:leucine-rich repeat domain-containing protein [Calditrichota bacterium]
MNKILFTILAISFFISCDGLDSTGNDNLPPMLAEIGDMQVNEGEELTFQLEANDYDGDSLTFEAENLPEGALLEDDLFFWTPDFDQSGEYEGVIFRVWDDGDPRQSDADTITITVNELNRPPVLASLPYPADSSEIDDFDITFSWECSDPDGDSLTFDVYFNDSPYMNVVSGAQSEKFYKPDTLLSDKTYYWKIVSKDGGHGGIEGPVWRFSTANLASSEPSNPEPADGTIIDAMYATLTWSCSDPEGDALLYDVYFGTSASPPLVSSGQSYTIYPTDVLELNTTYYWKIVVDDGHEHFIESELWSFTIAEDVAIIFPDRYLERMVRLRMDKPSGHIYVSDLAAIETFDAQQSGITNLTGMEFMTGLTKLNMPRNQITDISPLSRLRQLIDLRLHQNEIVDVTPLAGLTHLDTLRLDVNEIRYIDALSGLTTLKRLYIQENKIGELSPLSELTELTELNLRYNRISDISDLSQLTGLKELLLSNNSISDLTPLSELKELDALSLYSNQVSDISPLSGLSELTYLDLSWNQIRDISPLSDMKNLTYLYLIDNRIRDISSLAGLSFLERLILSENQISTLDSLSGLTSLNYLWVGNNLISDVQPISTLPNLQYLYLDDNNISDLWPLSELVSIRKLHLDNNGIIDIYPLVRNQGLSTGDILYIRYNQLSTESIREYIPQLVNRGVIIYR